MNKAIQGGTAALPVSLAARPSAHVARRFTVAWFGEFRDLLAQRRSAASKRIHENRHVGLGYHVPMDAGGHSLRNHPNGRFQTTGFTPRMS
jgi:hypothetical protein